MYRNAYLLLFIELFLKILGYGQTASVNYIVTLSNDTVRGTVTDDYLVESIDAIYFAKDEQAIKIKYGPGDIKSFFSSKGLYISVKTDIDYSPIEITQLRESPRPEMQADTVFLKVLSNGKASLLFFRDKNSKPHYFITIGDNKYTELINYSYLALAANTDFDKDYVRTIPLFRGILNYYFADCPQAKRRIKDLNYGEKAFLNIFEEYEKCHPESETTYIVKPKLNQYDIGVLAGIGKSEVYIMRNSDPVFTDFSYQPHLFLGAALNIRMNGRLKALFFNNELVFSRFNSKVSVSNINGIVKNYNEAHITSLDFALNSMVKAAIPIKSVSAYFTFGMRNSLVYFPENEIIRSSTLAGTTTFTTSPLLEFYKRYVFGLVLGVGADYKRFGMEMRYNPQYGMDIDKRLIMGYSTSSVNFMLKYSILSRNQ